jgi:hypothetical protein
MRLYTNRRSCNKGLYRTKRTNKGLKITNKSINDNVKYGGINPNLTDANFRYTIQRTRINWVKNIYPGLESLTRSIVEIDWSVNYRVTAPVTIKGRLATGIYRPESTDVTISIQINDTLKPIFAGGICYEILNDHYQPLGVPDLHTIVDPTGDIDIQMLNPSYNIAPSDSERLFNAANEVNTELVEYANSINGNIETVISSFLPLRMGTNINPIYGELLNAVFSKCVGALGTLDLNVLFPNATEFDISEYKISHGINVVNATDMFGFREQRIGHLHLVAYLYLTPADIDALGDNEYKTDMRLQLVAKFDNDNVVDHCLEIIIPMIQTSSFEITGEGLLVPFENAFCIDGDLNNGFKSLTLTDLPKKFIEVPVNDSYKSAAMRPLNELLEDNIDAYSERVKRLGHKAYNHVGRMLYLFILMMHKPSVGDNLIRFRLLDHFFKNIMEKIPRILTHGFAFAKLDMNGDLQTYKISMQDLLLAFAPVLLRTPHKRLIGWFDKNIKIFSHIISDKDIQANDDIKNYDLSSDESKAATSAAYDRIINGTTSIGLGGSRNSRRRHRGGNRSKKQR